MFDHVINETMNKSLQEKRDALTIKEQKTASRVKRVKAWVDEFFVPGAKALITMGRDDQIPPPYPVIILAYGVALSLVVGIVAMLIVAMVPKLLGTCAPLVQGVYPTSTKYSVGPSGFGYQQHWIEYQNEPVTPKLGSAEDVTYLYGQLIQMHPEWSSSDLRIREEKISAKCYNVSASRWPESDTIKLNCLKSEAYANYAMVLYQAIEAGEATHRDLLDYLSQLPQTESDRRLPGLLLEVGTPTGQVAPVLYAAPSDLPLLPVGSVECPE